MPKRISKEIENEIVRLYKNGSGTYEIAKTLNLNYWTINKYLRLHGIELDGKTRPYKNKFNIHFFNEVNPNSVYWAGFILADGNIGHKKRLVQIALKKEDEGHLKKFADLIDFTGPIYTDVSTDARSIQVRGEWFVNDLKRLYNIGPRKSLSAEFPDVPEEYLHHFVRGYFDGDGSISYGAGKRPNILAISFIGNTEVITTIQNILIGRLDIRKSPIQKTKSKNIIQFSYCSNDAKKILDWMYNGSENSNRLDRKYNRYIDYKENYKDGRCKPHTEEFKNMMSNLHKGNKYTLGRKRSEKERKRISECLTGRPVSKETREKISKANSGKVRSEEVKKNISGERNHKSSLTNEEVRFIRAKYKNGGVTHQQLADMYGVSRKIICNIVNNKSYKDI